MKNDWEKELSEFFEEYRIILSSQKDALEDFSQFCEFVAEPAFENLEDELREYGVRSKIIRVKGRSISFIIYYGKSRIDHFRYILELPKKAVEMRLRLRIKGRKRKQDAPEEAARKFLPEITPEQIMKLDKNILIMDVIENYRDFIFSSEAAMDE
ncbi:MAG: hypothetical protein ACOC5U_02385 [Candidatus Aminicenantaceae bacterium]